MKLVKLNPLNQIADGVRHFHLSFHNAPMMVAVELWILGHGYRWIIVEKWKKQRRKNNAK